MAKAVALRALADIAEHTGLSPDDLQRVRFGHFPAGLPKQISFPSRVAR